MITPRLSLALLLPLALCSCMVPTGPVEVSRFHLEDTSALGHGSIAVVAAPGADPASNEQQSFQIAVEQRLSALGYAIKTPDAADQIAQVRFSHGAQGGADRPRVGLAASGGSYGSGGAMGITIPLGSTARTSTSLAVMIRNRASGQVLWEGRAGITVAASSPLSDTALAAPRLADGLFAGFPGNSGETIQVK